MAFRGRARDLRDHGDWAFVTTRDLRHHAAARAIRPDCPGDVQWRISHRLFKVALRAT